MINNKKGISLPSMILMAVLLIIVTTFLVTKTTSVTDDADEKLNLLKYIPADLQFKEDIQIPSDIIAYSYDFVTELLTTETDVADNPIPIGKFKYVSRETFKEDFSIGFQKIESTHFFIQPSSEEIAATDLESAKTGTTTYYQNEFFKPLELEDIKKLLENKQLVVMPRQIKNNEYDAAIFLNYVTGLPLKRQRAIDAKAEVGSLEELLEKHTVKELSFTLKEEPKIYFRNLDGKIQQSRLTLKDKPLLVYEYKNYIVFFPLSLIGVELDKEGEIHGTGFFDTEIFGDLENQKIII